MNRFQVTLLILWPLCQGIVAQAQATPEAVTFPEFQVTIELRCLTLPRAQAVLVVRHLRSPVAEEKSKALAELDGLVVTGFAKLAGWPTVTTYTGQKATVECVEEIRFATEFEPNVSHIYVNEKSGEMRQQTPEIHNDLEPTASAFETRNTGVTLEVEPTVSADGSSVSLSYVAQHVRLLSIDRSTVEREFSPEKRSSKTIVEVPRFLTVKVQTATSLGQGEQQLIGAFPLPSGDEIELFILGAEIAKVKK